MQIYDAHAHIYSTDEECYPPAEKALRPPAGKGTLEHLLRETRDSAIRAVCAVQTSSFYRFDNRYILDASTANRKWMVGVCTLDPDDSGGAAQLALYVREHNVRGMRSLPAADGHLDHPGVRALWRAARDLGIVINLLIDPPLAGEADVLLAAFPDLRVTLDHCLNLKAGPDLARTIMELKRLARRPNLHAKLTFVASGSAEPYPFADMHGPCIEVVDAFGPDRCAWGSDFPCELWIPRATYAQHLRLFTHEIPMSDAARIEVLGGTAHRLWFSELE